VSAAHPMGKVNPPPDLPRLAVEAISQYRGFLFGTAKKKPPVQRGGTGGDKALKGFKAPAQGGEAGKGRGHAITTPFIY